MAATGFTPILIYASGTSTNVPLAANLTSGSSGAELALNYADGKLFYKDSGGTVQVLATKASAISPITNNGVVYINGSGQATTGSALTFDGTLLSNTGSSSAATLQVLKLANSGAGANTKTQIGFFAAGTQYGQITAGYGGSSPEMNFQLPNATTGVITWGLSGSAEDMRLTSTGLGIGTPAPSGKLTVKQGAAQIDVTTGANSVTFENIDRGNLASAVDTQFYTRLGKFQWFNGSYSEAMRLDSSGNLGLGVTPSAWGTYKAFEVGTVGNAVSGGVSSTLLNLSSNAYYNGGWKYANTTTGANLFQMTSGAYYWYTNATAGTAGASISFSQVMTLDASGNLGVGASSPLARFHSLGTSTTAYDGSGSGSDLGAQLTTGTAIIGNTDTTVGSFAQLVFQPSKDSGPAYARIAAIKTAAASSALAFSTRDGSTVIERARIDSSGSFGLGVTPSAWSYRSLSVGSTGTAIWQTGNDFGLSQNAYNNAGWKYAQSSVAAALYDISAGQHVWYNAPSGTAGNAISFTQAMTLDASGRLGVGQTSPTYKLDLSVAPGSSAGDGLQISSPSALVWLGVTGSPYSTYGVGSNEAWLYSTANLNIGPYGAYAIKFVSNGAERARIDSSGNLGLGVTPSAWGGGWRSIDNGTWGGYYSNDGGFTGISGNAYRDAGGWKYKGATTALRYEQTLGTTPSHAWYVAATGTAGNAISFTQAMTLDASGRLLLNRTNNNNNETLQVNGNANAYAASFFGNSTSNQSFGVFIGAGTSSSDWALRIMNAATNTDFLRVTGDGNLLVGQTSVGQPGIVSVKGSNGYGVEVTGNGGSALNADYTYGSGTGYYGYFKYGGTLVGSISSTGSSTSYNTSSDYRLKDNQQPLTGSGAFIDALQPKTWEWKADGSKGVGFIAHEVQAVSPGSVVGEKDAVDEDGKPKYQAMEYGSAEFIANIVAELQSLRKRLAAAGIA